MITNQDWGLSVTTPGAFVQGNDDIIQCVNNIFTTQKGTDPFRPDFGVDILSNIDLPVTVAQPNIVAEMLRALEYEPRVTVTGILTKIEYSKIIFNVQGSVTNNPSQPISIFFVFTTEDGIILITEQNSEILYE